MKVVNENVESKRDIIKELKSININSTNKHNEIELDSYIVSIVMIITTVNVKDCEDKEYNVYMLIQDKKTDDLYGKYNSKTFKNDEEANIYYNDLSTKAGLYTDGKVKELIRKI